MRKLCFVLIALLLTVPALAVVNVSCAQVGDDPFEVEVSYTSTGSLPRAFALDITVDAGTIIEVTDVNEKFWVYPGTIQITNGSIDDEGDPVAPYDDPCALGGEGTSGMTIEMGSLYSPNDVEHTTGPAASGTLLRFTVSDECTVTIEGNGARGNVVLENTTAADTNLPTTCVVESEECYTGPDYTEWVTVGSPSCWCNPRQCHGDAAGDLAGDAKNGYWYVGATDLTIFTTAWKVKEPATAPTPSGPGVASITDGICADFAHDLAGDAKNGYWRVGATDLTVLTTWWKVKEPATAPTPSGPGVPADCLTASPVSP